MDRWRPRRLRPLTHTGGRVRLRLRPTDRCTSRVSTAMKATTPRECPLEPARLTHRLPGAHTPNAITPSPSPLNLSAVPVWQAAPSGTSEWQRGAAVLKRAASWRAPPRGRRRPPCCTRSRPGSGSACRWPRRRTGSCRASASSWLLLSSLSITYRYVGLAFRLNVPLLMHWH